MRILVISDTHGHTDRLHRVLDVQPQVRYVLFLGDGLRDLDDAEFRYPDKVFYTVLGNCDATFDRFGGVGEREETLGGKRFFFTHGHRYEVKRDTDRLLMAARSRRADVVLYGHTHRPETRYEDGLYVMNPGSLGAPPDGRPSYGLVDITPAGVVLNIVFVD